MAVELVILYQQCHRGVCWISDPVPTPTLRCLVSIPRGQVATSSEKRIEAPVLLPPAKDIKVCVLLEWDQNL